MNFVKMHGLGNDYVYIDCFKEQVAAPRELAIQISDRHFGVGGDGLVLIMPSAKADAGMRIFNADGSEAEMCGNAIRCVGKYLYDERLVTTKRIRVETLAGIKELHLEVTAEKVSSVKVDMGEPVLDSELVPVKGPSRRIVAEPIQVNQRQYLYTAVSMGNPHCVIFLPEVNDDIVLNDGPKIEIHPDFPRKTNVEFIKLINRSTIEMRVWERGSGETMACGTGACAAVVAAVLNEHTDRSVTVLLKGGKLLIEWDRQSNHVFKTGPATMVFKGEWLL